MTLRAALGDFVARVVDASPSLRPRAADARALIDAMTEGWGERGPDAPPYLSFLSRDGTPFEPSVRIAREASDLRFVLEVQPPDASREPAAYLEAALALYARLEARGWAELSHARRLEDLFRAHLPAFPAALWFGASLGPVGPPLLKNYFVCSEPSQWREAFTRFGLADLARELAEAIPPTARVEIVSVDLAGPDPRLKLYLRHRVADPDDIDRAHARDPSWRKGDAALLLHGMFGGVPSVRKNGPISTYHVSLERRAVTHGSLNLPLEPLHYKTGVPADDGQIADRVARLVESLGLAVDPLYPSMLAEARRDGIRYPHHRYAGVQRRGDAAEVTVYLSTLLQARRHGLTYGPVRLGPAVLETP